jgi:hypothetical protein
LLPPFCSLVYCQGWSILNLLKEKDHVDPFCLNPQGIMGKFPFSALGHELIHMGIIPFGISSH